MVLITCVHNDIDIKIVIYNGKIKGVINGNKKINEEHRKPFIWPVHNYAVFSFFFITDFPDM